MHTFDDIKAYLSALKADPALAVISMKMAAAALEVSRAAVERQLDSGALDGARIGKVRCVLASSVLARQDARRDKVAKVRKFLEALAAKGKTTVYAPVMELVGMKTRVPRDRAAIGYILGEISRATDATEKPRFLLSALVFNKNAGKPSPSFFALAHELGYGVADEDRFLDRQLKKIWKRYGAVPSS